MKLNFYDDVKINNFLMWMQKWFLMKEINGNAWMDEWCI